MHFLGLKWDNKSGRVSIGFREEALSTEINLKPLNVGSDITLKIFDGSYCVGHYSHPDYKYVVCGRRLDPGQRQCGSCRFKDSGLFLPLSALKNDQKALLEQQPHHNYLNLFGSSTIKTGVAATIRQNTRVWEQGAHASLFFASCDGVVAREIEEWISRNFDEIKTLMQVGTKAGLLYTYSNKQTAEDLLRNTLAEIVKQIPDRYQECFLGEPKFLYNIGLYHLENKTSVIYSLSKLDDIPVISGKILSVVGEIVILEDAQKRRIALNSKLLIGRLLNINDSMSSDVLPEDKLKKIMFGSVNQTSLFD